MSKMNDTLVSLTEIRAERMLSEIREAFSGEGPTIDDAEALAVRIAEQLRILPLDRRRVLRWRLAVAVHDVEGLIAALETEMTALADELQTVNRHSDASQAYGRGAIIDNKRF